MHQFKIYPEKNIAARLVKNKKLAPPIDIFSLAKQYAKVDLMIIPFDVDGISLNLKVPSKTPHIIINEQIPDNRIRFTLAHELGHVLIPWHLGSIIDKTFLPADEDHFNEYWYLEGEANRFASELLMPSIWTRSIIEKLNYDLYRITNQIVKEASVSSHAATIKIKDIIKPGYLFAVLSDDNRVIFSGRSEGTFANLPKWDEIIEPDELFPFCQHRYFFEINGFHYYWWVFDENISISRFETLVDWRVLLDKIVVDIGVPFSNQIKFKQSLNGIIAYANGRVRGQNRTPELLCSAVLQRICGHPELKKLIDHPKFNSFIYSRIESLLNH
jgi:Zn-dependent peptidase ImmA (M78 family)